MSSSLAPSESGSPPDDVVVPRHEVWTTKRAHHWFTHDMFYDATSTLTVTVSDGKCADKWAKKYQLGKDCPVTTLTCQLDGSIWRRPAVPQVHMREGTTCVVTFTTIAYAKFTNNWLATQAACECEGYDVIVVVDSDECVSHIRIPTTAKFATRVVSLQQKALESMAMFATTVFSEMMRNKWLAVTAALRTGSEHVVWCDGDIVVRKADWVRDMVAARRESGRDILFQSSPKTTNLRSRPPHDVSKELCAGLCVLRNCEAMRVWWSPWTARPSSAWPRGKCDQFTMRRFKTKFRFSLGTLNVEQFIDGYTLARLPKYVQTCTIVHYNFMMGDEKENAMRRNGHWMLSDDEDVKHET